MGYGNGDESDGGSPWIEKARRNMNRNASNGWDRNWDWPHRHQKRKMSNPEKKKLYSQVNLYFRPFLIDVVDFSTIRNWGLPSQKGASFLHHVIFCKITSQFSCVQLEQESCCWICVFVCVWLFFVFIYFWILYIYVFVFRFLVVLLQKETFFFSPSVLVVPSIDICVLFFCFCISFNFIYFCVCFCFLVVLLQKETFLFSPSVLAVPTCWSNTISLSLRRTALPTLLCKTHRHHHLHCHH